MTERDTVSGGVMADARLEDIVEAWGVYCKRSSVQDGHARVCPAFSGTFNPCTCGFARVEQLLNSAMRASSPSLPGASS